MVKPRRCQPLSSKRTVEAVFPGKHGDRRLVIIPVLEGLDLYKHIAQDPDHALTEVNGTEHDSMIDSFSWKGPYEDHLSNYLGADPNLKHIIKNTLSKCLEHKQAESINHLSRKHIPVSN